MTKPQGRRLQVYSGYRGKSNPSERERIMHLLDEYRCTEGFVSEYLARWLAISNHENVKGGLRMIQEREAAHARLLEARLRELGGVPQCTVPAEQRTQLMALYASPERTDEEKLQSLAILFQDPVDFLQPLVDLIAEIREDQHSKELLRMILDDEKATIHWLVEMYRTCSTAEGAAQ